MTALPKRVSQSLLVLLSAFLFLSSTGACWAQLVQSKADQECCNQGSCHRMPKGTSCQAKPAHSNPFVTPDIATPDISLAVGPIIDNTTNPAAALTTTHAATTYSPPHLYIIHSAFLI